VEPGDGLKKIMDQEVAGARCEAREELQRRLRGLPALLVIVFVGAVILTLGFLSWLFGGAVAAGGSAGSETCVGSIAWA
jgi:hypothetical protein